MASRAQFRVEEFAKVPQGWKVRTKLSGAHRVRIAFPPGPRRKGSGKLIEVLHPKGGDNPCSMRGKNPSELVIFNPSRRRKARLTPEQNRAWEKAFQFHVESGKSDSSADRLAWRDLVAEFPSLKKFSGAHSNPSRRRQRNSGPASKMTSQEKSYWEERWIEHKRSGVSAKEADYLATRDTASKFPRLKGRLGSASNPRRKKRNVIGVGSLLAGVAEQAGGTVVAKKVMSHRRRKHPKGKRRKRNPDELQQAVDLYQTFHGKDPQGVVEEQRSSAMRMDYTALGELLGLGIYRSGDRVPEPDHWESYPGAVKFSRSGEGVVMLASSSDGAQLYALGGDQNMLAVAKDVGADVSKDLIEVGELAFVVYFARKAPDFQPVEWMHKFESPRPVLGYDQIKSEIFFVGGGYSVEAPGIVK